MCISTPTSPSATSTKFVATKTSHHQCYHEVIKAPSNSRLAYPATHILCHGSPTTLGLHCCWINTALFFGLTQRSFLG